MKDSIFVRSFSAVFSLFGVYLVIANLAITTNYYGTDGTYFGFLSLYHAIEHTGFKFNWSTTMTIMSMVSHNLSVLTVSIDGVDFFQWIGNFFSLFWQLICLGVAVLIDLVDSILQLMQLFSNILGRNGGALQPVIISPSYDWHLLNYLRLN